MRQPCDEAVIASGALQAPCRETSAPWVLAAAILGSSMAFIDGTVVNVALPALQSSLHADVVDVQWVVESYGLFLSALILVGGALGDLFGRRRVFLLGTALFAAASVACGLSTTVTNLVIARCVQGIGAAALVPSSLAIIGTSFDKQSRGRAIGTWSGFTAITTAFGPVLGGWLVQHASWHWVFFINVPLAAIVILISIYHVPESRSSDAGDVDWLGALIVTLGLGGLIFGFVESATLGWRSPAVFGSLAVGFFLLLIFVRVEQRAAQPMVPLRLFQSRSFAGANLLTLMLYAALGVLFFFVPLNLIQIQRYSPTAAGAASIPAVLLMFSLSRWSGGLVTRLGPKLPLAVGPVIATAGFVLFAVPSVGGSYWITFFPAYLLLGLGMTVTVAPLTSVVMSSVEENRAGTASGINNAVARVAGVLAVAVFGIVMVQAFGYKLQELLNRVALDPGVLHQIQSNLIKLGGLEVPATLDPPAAATLRTDIAQAFVFAFRLVMLICAALSLASASVALKMIPKRTT